MTKQSRPFGQMEGREIPLLTLKNETMAVELLPLGAAVRSLWVPDKGGNPTDVVLGIPGAGRLPGGHPGAVRQPHRRGPLRHRRPGIPPNRQ